MAYLNIFETEERCEPMDLVTLNCLSNPVEMSLINSWLGSGVSTGWLPIMDLLDIV